MAGSCAERSVVQVDLVLCRSLETTDLKALQEAAWSWSPSVVRVLLTNHELVHRAMVFVHTQFQIPLPSPENDEAVYKLFGRGRVGTVPSRQGGFESDRWVPKIWLGPNPNSDPAEVRPVQISAR